MTKRTKSRPLGIVIEPFQIIRSLKERQPYLNAGGGGELQIETLARN